VSLEEQARGSTTLPGPDILDPDDLSITSYTDYLFLTLPVDAQGTDWLRDDFSLIII